MINLGKLEKVDIRTIWKHEASSFTPWLAEPENLTLLGEAINIDFDIEDIQTEVGVGDFSADILTKDMNDKTIIIENQLERTDHDHLGKCITYAAGVGAETIIWISRNVRDEHRQAIEWLNNNSSDKLNFFLIEIGAYKINNSEPAPYFNIIESPNEWAKAVRNQSNSSQSITETKLKQQKFFESISEYGKEHSKKVKSWQKPLPQHWYTIRFGSGLAHIDIYANTREECIRIALYIDGGKGTDEQNRRIFEKIFESKDAIENKLGQLVWNGDEEKRMKMISFQIDKNPMDEQEAAEAIPLVIKKIDDFLTIFPKYIKK